MRLIRCQLFITELNRGLLVEYTHGGAPGRLSFELPTEWDAWTRPEKIAWVKTQVTSQIQNGLYLDGGEIIFPDVAVQDTAADDFEALSGWATWTAAEAEGWIEINVTNLATAKTALKAMAKAIVHLRDRVIPK